MALDGTRWHSMSQYSIEMPTPECNLGMRYRKSYIRKGRRISGKCIRSQTHYRNSLRLTRERMKGVRISRRTLRNCPNGYIKRASYMRYTRKGKHSLIPEQCIRNVGAPGKGYANGPGIGPLRKGELSKYGYKDVVHMSLEDRRAALENALKEFGSLGVFRKLNAVHVYTRRIAPAASRVFKEDMEWIRKTFGLKAF